MTDTASPTQTVRALAITEIDAIAGAGTRLRLPGDLLVPTISSALLARLNALKSQLHEAMPTF